MEKPNIEKLFTYHPPKEGQPERYALINTAARKLAEVIVYCTPPGADQSSAIRKVREARMTANAAISLED